MRQIVLDTETTGVDPKQGHRIIEIGCVELIDRKLSGRHYHQYINPQREVEQGAIDVHGITNEFLVDKPVFKDIEAAFIEFVQGAELVIHNAPFDVGFINHELGLLESAASVAKIETICGVLDTLELARDMHPGQRNSLDALCKRYEIDNSHRDLHGALLDAEILADVYLRMTGGQTKLDLSNEGQRGQGTNKSQIRRIPAERAPFKVLSPSEEEQKAHEAYLTMMKESHEMPMWRKLKSELK